MEIRTQTVPTLKDEVLRDDWLYIFSTWRPDDRSSVSFWLERHNRLPNSSIKVSDEYEDKVHIVYHEKLETIDLRDTSRLKEMMVSAPGVYIDISGISLHVFAPFIKAGVEVCKNLYAMYTEPKAYLLHTSPVFPSLFDLTERFTDVAPLPGFANLRGPADETKSLFVPFLGFEGSRARQLMVHLDPAPPHIFPIVGVPGFQIEYPNYTIACNTEFFDDQQVYDSIRLAQANCPFAAFNALQSIRQEFPDYYFYIAPVGTKPHGLGAILFAIDHPENAEIMYDHPIRKSGGRRGKGPTNIYSIKET